MTDQPSFKIVKIVNTSLFKITRDGSGAIPDKYNGLYTSPQLAQKDVDKYLIDMEEKTSHVNYKANRLAEVRKEVEAELAAKAESEIRKEIEKEILSEKKIDAVVKKTTTKSK